MDEREIKLKLCQSWVIITTEEEREDLLGFEWLQEAGFSYEADQASYNKAKKVLAELESVGWFKATRREKNRKGRPGQYWVITDKGRDGWGKLADERWSERPVESRLRESKAGKIRVSMPCEREIWQDITRLARAGKINLIVCWADEDG